MCYIDITKVTVACMSLLLLSIDLRRLCYYIMFYFKLNNGAMVKWWIVKWCNGEIKIRIVSFVSNKYWICSFVSFSNTSFFAASKAIHNLRYLITNNKYRKQVYVIKPSNHQKTGLYKGSANHCERYRDFTAECAISMLRKLRF